MAEPISVLKGSTQDEEFSVRAPITEGNLWRLVVIDAARGRLLDSAGISLHPDITQQA